MESIIYELRANNVKEEDIKTVIEKVKNRLTEENIDIELQNLGYTKIFTVDYDEYDIDSFSDDDYDYDKGYTPTNRRGDDDEYYNIRH